MSSETQALLDAFEHLPAEEKRIFAQEVLRRCLPFDSGAMSDQEIEKAGTDLFQSLEDHGDSAPRKSG